MSAGTAFNCIRQSLPDTGVAEIGVIGIGNTLMGDDGAGILVLEKLQSLPRARNSCFFYALSGDLFEMADMLGRAKRFIFIDAYIGSPAGTITVFSPLSPAPMPSLHQTDIGTVMRMLEPLGLCHPFPSWEVRGIAVEPPFRLGAGLSIPVAQGVEKLVKEIATLIV
jgi:hydrogenase maturation protease